MFNLLFFIDLRLFKLLFDLECLIDYIKVLKVSYSLFGYLLLPLLVLVIHLHFQVFLDVLFLSFLPVMFPVDQVLCFLRAEVGLVIYLVCASL